MSEGLCSSSMFGGDRWSVGVNPMTAGNYAKTFPYILTNNYNKTNQLLTYPNTNQGFGQLNQSSSLSQSLNGGLNSGINISSAMSAGGYQHYGLNALGSTFATFFAQFLVTF